jgi:ribonuclease-3
LPSGGSKASDYKRDMGRLNRLLGPLARKAPSPDLDAHRRKALGALSRALGVRFRDLALLNQALKHRSYVHDAELDRTESNERMEFLGDAVLGLLVNEHLYYKYERRQEGRLTKIKSLVVSETILSRKAEELSLGKYILLSENERSSGGATRTSIIADAFEAVIGAVYLDSGLKAARRFVESHLLSEIDELLQVDEYQNYKSMVQEYAQKKYGARPRYRVVSAKGPEHERVFFVELRLGGHALGRGEGKNKKEAEQLAARSALAKLGLLQDGTGSGRSSKRRRGGRRRSRRRKKKEKAP